MAITLSPYARTMGFETSRDAEGHLLMTMPYSIAMRGRPGFVHGGALAGLLETVAYATLSEALGSDDKAVVKPINVTVSFMRGATEQLTYARATIERLGRRVANVEAIAWQDDPEKPVAVAQMNVMLSR
ncbi:MAG: PaaI family thioesterase [Sphingomonadales bacterium]|jgi:uncharacterized protein (TIGR00369 family)|nr:PaaI family thioesterase [Sphingomonadales bacterium]